MNATARFQRPNNYAAERFVWAHNSISEHDELQRCNVLHCFTWQLKKRGKIISFFIMFLFAINLTLLDFPHILYTLVLSFSLTLYLSHYLLKNIFIHVHFLSLRIIYYAHRVWTTKTCNYYHGSTGKRNKRNLKNFVYMANITTSIIH